MASVLTAHNVHFHYPDGEKVLKGVNFTAQQGEVVALLGANGCGKTTFLQCLNGLIKPQIGEIYLNGELIAQKRTAEIFRTVGLVFQDPNDQLFAATVAADISYGPINLGCSQQEVKARVDRTLELMGLTDLQNKSIHSLSYGQKKKTAIAGILALEPKIIVLDEPTAGLDPIGASKLMSLLRSVQKQSGQTIILTTHDVDLVPIYCDRVYLMNDGKMHLEGTPEAVFSQVATIRSLNLRLPRVAHLMEVLTAKDGWNMPKPGLTISQARNSLKGFFHHGN